MGRSVRGSLGPQRHRHALSGSSIAGAALLALGAAITVAPAAGAQPATAPAPYQDGSVLVTYAPGVSDAAKDDAEASAGAADVGTLGGDAGGSTTTVLAVPSGTVPDAVARLAARPEVRSVEPNYLVHRDAVPNDPSFAQLYALSNTGQTVSGTAGTPGADIGAAAAWATTTGSRSVVIGDVDSGIDYTHPDLAANVWSNPGGIGGCAAGTHGYNALASSCDPADDDSVGHGTHVAGTMGAVGNNRAGVTGVNWSTSIMGLKFLDANGNGSVAGAIKAIDFAVTAKQAGVNIRVLNNSWTGAGFSQALADEIAKANANGILFVAAAGNSGTDNDRAPVYPASYDLPNVISVAATTNTDALATFSDYGATSVDLGAPGLNILSTLPGGRYGYLSGTSMATPQVSGAAALLLSAPALASLGPADLKARLLGAVDADPALAGRTVTGGRLDVCAALPGCGSSGPSPTTVTLSTSGNAGVGVAGVVLTATVSPATVGGTVAFSDGGNAIAGCGARPVSAGAATCVATFATAGTHSITTAYSGDATHANASATTPVDVTATPDFFQLGYGFLIAFAHNLGLFGLG